MLLQVWTMSQPTPAFTLDGHDKGVNSVDYFSGGMRLNLTALQQEQTVSPSLTLYARFVLT